MSSSASSERVHTHKSCNSSPHNASSSMITDSESMNDYPDPPLGIFANDPSWWHLEQAHKKQMVRRMKRSRRRVITEDSLDETMNSTSSAPTTALERQQSEKRCPEGVRFRNQVNVVEYPALQRTQSELEKKGGSGWLPNIGGLGDDEEESTDDPSDPLDSRPGLADLFSEIDSAETELLREDLFFNVKQYVDYKLIYDFAFSPKRSLKLTRPAEITRCLVFPDIQQFKRDFDRICTLVKINHPDRHLELSFGSEYMAKKRLGPLARPGDLDTFFEVLESTIFNQPIVDLGRSKKHSIPQNDFQPNPIEKSESPNPSPSRRKNIKPRPDIFRTRSLEEDKRKIFTCIISLINQASVALILKMFTAWVCVQDGQIPPSIQSPTRVVRANSQMGAGSSQIDLIFDVNQKSPVFVRREYVEVMNLEDLEGPTSFFCLKQTISRENSQWVVEITIYETLRNVDQKRVNRNSLAF